MTPCPPDAADPARETERREARRRLRAALDALPPAEALGVPRKTLSAQVRRGLDRLGRDLGREPSRVGRALALLPVAPPIGGWDAALASWTQTALQGLAVAAPAATSTITGLTLMSSKTLLVLSLTVAVGVGFLGGSMSTRRGDTGEPDASYANNAPAQLSVDANSSGSPSLTPAASAEAEIQRLRGEVVALQRRLAEMERASAEREATRRPSGPTFTFGELGRLPAVLQADWQEMAEASTVVSACVLDIHQHVERMRKYEYETFGKMPTAAKHNGEITHPITMANLFAAILEQQGLPPDADQVRRIAAVLTPEQRAVVYDPATRGLAGLDLHSPTLMLLHTSPVLTGASGEEIAGKLRGLLAEKLAPDARQGADLDRLVDGWRREIDPLLEPVPAAQVKHWSFEQGEAAAVATVRLVERILQDLQLGDEARKGLLEDHAVYVPRVPRG